MENVTFSPSSLLCTENETTLDGQKVEEYAFTAEDDDEYVQMLLDKENGAQDHRESSQVIDNTWMKQARFDAIQYIFNTRASFGFKLETAYLSVTYLDRFLSRRYIGDEQFWAIRLLAMTCISLAAKMEEYRVPPLSDLSREDYNFESRVIQRMELLVLTTLEWRIFPITPFTFINYFVSRFCTNSQSNNIKSSILELILVSVKDLHLMSYKPSVIAAAATLIILDPKSSREALEVKFAGSSSIHALNIEDVWPCFNEMQHSETERFKMESPTVSPIQLQKINTLDKSSNTPATSGKRKRLGFNES